MNNNKGSAMIIVIIIMSFIMVFATSTVSITHSEEITSKSNNDSNTAFYIAEAGIERAVNIIKNEEELQSYIDNVLKEFDYETEDNVVKEAIVNAISSYLNTHFPPYPPDSHNPKNTIKYKYQYYEKGSSGHENSNGLDTQKFSTLLNSPSYYNLTVSPVTSPAPSYDGNLFTEDISIKSTGYYNKASRTITAVYRIEYTKKDLDKPPSDANLDEFFSNTLSLISPTPGGVFQFHQGCEIEGDAIIYNITPDGGNSKKTATVLGNLSYNNPTRPSNISAQSYTNVTNDYVIPQIDPDNVPSNSGNIVYIYKNKTSNFIDSSEVSDFNKIYVILSNHDVIMDKKTRFKGVIYCTGKLILSGNGQGLELWGTVIARGLQGKNHITVHKLNDASALSSIKDAIYDSIHPDVSGEMPLKFVNYDFNPVSWTE